MATAKRWITVSGVAVVTILAAAIGGYRLQQETGGENLAFATAEKGEFLVVVRVRGQLRARRSVQVMAPRRVPDLRLTWMAPPGSHVNEGETVLRLDTSGLEQEIQEDEADLRQAQARLDQAQADIRITEERDQRAVKGGAKLDRFGGGIIDRFWGGAAEQD